MRKQQHRLLALGAIAAASFTLLISGPVAAQQVFATPEAASAALVEAAKAPDMGPLDTVFGADAKALLSSGDLDVDRRHIADFLGLAADATGVTDGKNGDKVLVFGAGSWPFPIPLKPVTGGWSFDSAAGRQQLTDQTIGENELVAIGACADYVAAQNEYFQSLHDDQPVQQFARKLLSTPGRHDGLFWEPEFQSDRSPLGDRIVAASIKTGAADGSPRSYHGYFYRILTRQGSSAPGGAYDYLVNGRLLAGFALIAYPEVWGETGIMTFLCDQRGNVFERNLGADTAAIAATIRSFNPGTAWDRVQP